MDLLTAVRFRQERREHDRPDGKDALDRCIEQIRRLEGLMAYKERLKKLLEQMA